MVETPATAMFVHERGNRSLDGLFRLIEVAGQSRPLAEVLWSICEQVAAVAPADVVSIYVRDRDGGDRQGHGEHGAAAPASPGEPGFTLRANVGFPAEAVGRVRLRLGEGIVGFVAERMRPVSVETAESDEHFKYVPGLGEERFPAMLAVPVLRGASAAAVLVLQRTAGETFSGEEVVLAMALAAVLSHALDRAEERERERERHATRTVARLRGVALVGEAAMGRAEILPTLSALAGSGLDAHEPGKREPGRLAFETVARRLRSEMGGVRSRAGASGATAWAGELASLMLLLDDRRFGEAVEAATAASNPHKALSELAREYAKVPFRTGLPDGLEAELMTSRASEIEDLCVLVHAAMAGRSIVRAGSIVVAERLRTFLALSAIASGASAFVIENDLPKNGLVAEVVRSSGRPLLARVKGVFAWVRPGDLLVVDAGSPGLKSGSVRVNPEATAVARFRTRR